MATLIALAVSSAPAAPKVEHAGRRSQRARGTCNPFADGIHSGMIKRFRHKGLEALFRTGSTKGVHAQLASKLRRALSRLNDGPLPEAMDLPGYRLHQLKGDRQGTWSV